MGLHFVYWRFSCLEARKRKGKALWRYMRSMTAWLRKQGRASSVVNDGVAVRNFRALLRNSQVVAEEEYMLYKLGTYDSKTMKVIGKNP